MTLEKNIVDHVESQHEVEVAWIDRNRPRFSAKASGWFGLVGRGAIIVDAVAKRLGEGALFTYFSKEQMEHIADAEISELVDDYDPSNEYIVLLLLPHDEKRAYRIYASEEQISMTESISGISYART